MRPLELALKDFRSFRGEHRIWLAGRRLVAVAGPIGAGKTSLLDAIAFALYGRTPKLGPHPVALINQEASETTVRLVFRVGESAWEVERLARRRGAGTAALYPYREPDGRNPLELVSGTRSVNARVEEILGMDFAAFSRSILLPQGEFAQFLEATAAEKDRVLKGVFRLERIDRMRQLARERSLAAALEAERVSAELDRSESAAAELDSLGPKLERAAARAAAAGKLQAAAAALDAGDQKVSAELEGSDAAVRALARTVARLRPEEEIAEVVAAARAAAAKNRAAAGRVRAARRELDSAESEQARFLADRGGEEGLELARASVSELIQQRARAAAAGTRLQQAEQALDDARRAAARLARELDEASAIAGSRSGDLQRAREERDAASARVSALERADMALTLREELAANDDCPVCGRPVAELPADHAHPDLDAARRQQKEADGQLGRAADALAAAREQAAAAAANRETAIEQAERHERDRDAARASAEADASRLEQIAASAAERLSSTDPEKTLADLDERLAGLRRAAAEAGARFRAAVSAEAEIRELGEAARQQTQELELELSMIAGEMGARSDAEDPGDRSVAELAARLRGFARDRERELARERGRIQKRAAGLADQRRRLLAEWDIPAAVDVHEFAAGIHARAATLRAREHELRGKAARLPELRRARRAVERRRRHLERLVEDLRDSRFLKYMLAGKRTQLAELGGQRIRQLTGGRFGFSPGDRFEIVDYAATDPELPVRSSHTLSGGETFLASLSLALALADLVAGQGGRLGSFFLDEGFGSLDADHLAIAMDGIERLASEADERLVVVVSHVPGVQERVEDQIILGAPNGAGGGSRILAGAAPA